MVGHLIVGSTGTGKTTYVKSLINKVDINNRLIYDVNNEYGVNIKLPNFQDFAERVTRIKNAFIVFEEATIFLNNRGSNQYIIDSLVRKRHTSNYYVLVFHSLRSVPKYIYDLCTHVTLFKTNDNYDLIDKRFKDDRLSKAFALLMKKDKEDYRHFTIKIY